MDVMSELDSMGNLVRANEYLAVLEKLRKLWDQIPDPKVNTPNAYLVIEYGAACSLKLGNMDEAQRWADLAPQFAMVRQDMGEVEFLVGKVAFERGDYDTARENFSIANVKSDGRSFIGKDNKYKRLIQ